MKEYQITLTEREIEVLRISLCETSLNLERTANTLEQHNRTGINAKAIEMKRECAKECDTLWNKLFDYTKIS